jgi:hypothetical protein
MAKAIVTKITPVDDNHEVVSTRSSDVNYMKKPCRDCPWKKSAAGVFPAEAFRVSAHTSYDMAPETFACHSAGTKKPKTCAGFLLRGATHNLSVRLQAMRGDIDFTLISDGGHALFENYKAMAIANGVSPDDPCLQRSRTD